MEYKESKRIRFGRISYLCLAIIFAIFVVSQVFVAGLAIFVNQINWTKHFLLVHVFGFNLPIFMLVVAFVGSMPRWAYWQIFGLLLSIFAMYFTANITSSVPWAGAVHPVIALVLFILTYSIVKRTWSLVFNRKSKGKKEI